MPAGGNRCIRRCGGPLGKPFEPFGFDLKKFNAHVADFLLQARWTDGTSCYIAKLIMRR